LAASNRDRISVDLRGLKAALVARAHAERLDVSVVVRRAVERELGLAAKATQPAGEPCTSHATSAARRLSIRLTPAEAAQLAACAARVGLSRGAFVAGLLAEVPLLVGGSAARPDLLAALNASCAELSTLTRNLHHLTALLRQGQLRAALEYREMLDTLGDDVRKHLTMAAGLLAELRPAKAARVAAQRQPSAAA
jgi:hypothetical protein